MGDLVSFLYIRTESVVSMSHVHISLTVQVEKKILIAWFSLFMESEF